MQKMSEGMKTSTYHSLQQRSSIPGVWLVQWPKHPCPGYAPLDPTAAPWGPTGVESGVLPVAHPLIQGLQIFPHPHCRGEQSCWSPQWLSQQHHLSQPKPWWPKGPVQVCQCNQAAPRVGRPTPIEKHFFGSHTSVSPMMVNKQADSHSTIPQFHAN